MRLLTPNLKYFFITNSEADALWGEFIIPLDERKDIYSWLSFSSDQRESLLYRMLCCSLFHPTSGGATRCYSATQLDNRCVFNGSVSQIPARGRSQNIVLVLRCLV